MKLRNKATQEVWNVPEWRTPAVQEGDICFFAELNGDGKLFSYKSLDELNKEWEDYQSAEPLIKDEKIREAVRAWAELNNIKEVAYIITGGGLSVFTKNGAEIDFTFQVQGVRDDRHYTIAELCGEEEE